MRTGKDSLQGLRRVSL